MVAISKKNKVIIFTLIISLTLIISSQYLGTTDNSPLPEFSLDCYSFEIYTGETLECSVSGNEVVIGYIWDFHDKTEMQFEMFNNTEISHTYNTPGSYLISVVGLSAYNLSSVETYEINVLPGFAMADIATNITTANFDGILTVQEDQPIEFYTNDIPPSISHFSWDFGDYVTVTGNTITHQYSESGNYMIKMTGELFNGLIFSKFLEINVENIVPTAEISVDSTSYIEDEIISFDASLSTDSASDIDSLDYIWQFDDGTVSDKKLTTHSYYENGKYQVSLTVIDDNGDKTSDIIEIVIDNGLPVINDLNITQKILREGENALFNSDVIDTLADSPLIDYLWNIYYSDQNSTDDGSNPSYFVPDDGTLAAELTVSDEEFSVSRSTQNFVIQNVNPYISLENVVSKYNLSLGIMGEKWSEINFTIYDDQTPMYNSTLQRAPGDPYQANVTFGNIIQSMNRMWQIKIDYAPNLNSSGGGANPVEILFTFENANDTYKLKHTFNVNHENTHHWSLYLNPLSWNFPVDLYYKVFDPGSDDLTVTTNYGNITYYTELLSNPGFPSIFDIVVPTRNYNVSEISYQVRDDDGASSSLYNVPISLDSNTTAIDWFAPRSDLAFTEEGYEDDDIFFSVKVPIANISDYSYKWHFGDSFVISTQSSTMTHQYTHSGKYLVWVIISDANKTYDRVVYGWLTIANPNLDISIADIPLYIKEDEQITFAVDSPEIREDYQFTWYLENRIIGTGTQIQYSFAESGEYFVTLFITDDQGGNFTLIRKVNVLSVGIEVQNIQTSFLAQEGETAILSQQVHTSILDQLNLDLTWMVENYDETYGTEDYNFDPIGEYEGFKSNWILDNGQYLATLEIQIKEDEVISHQTLIYQTIEIQDVSPIIKLSDFNIYGNSNGVFSIPFSVSDSLQDLKSLEYKWAYMGSSSQWELFGDNSIRYLEFNPQEINGPFTSTMNPMALELSVRDNQGITYTDVNQMTIVDDKDGDLLTDMIEEEAGTDIYQSDTDNDGIIDAFEGNLLSDIQLFALAPFASFIFDTSPIDFDTDNDGLTDGYYQGSGEIIAGTDPLLNDTDFDGLLDGQEVNGWQVNLTINGINTIFEVSSSPLVKDSDNDGLSDSLEFEMKSNPWSIDTDNDGIYDTEEYRLGLSSLTMDDSDDDGLLDSDELEGYEIEIKSLEGEWITSTVKSNPMARDTDGDGLSDAMERQLKSDPTKIDSDQDYLSDYEEVYSINNPYSQTHFYNPDEDGDGLLDGEEILGWNMTSLSAQSTTFNDQGEMTNDLQFDENTVYVQSNPWRVDTDNDGLSDFDEINPEDGTMASNPVSVDSDNDGLPDSKDDTPLLVDITPPEYTTDIELGLEFTAVEVAEELLHSVTGTAATILGELGTVTSDIWNIIKNNPSRSYYTNIKNYFKEKIKDYLGDEHDWDYSSLSMANFFVDYDLVPDITQELLEFDIKEKINPLINWGDLWSAITDEIPVWQILFRLNEVIAIGKQFFRDKTQVWVEDYIYDYNNPPAPSPPCKSTICVNSINDPIQTILNSVSFDFDLGITFNKNQFDIPTSIKSIDPIGSFSFNLENTLFSDLTNLDYGFDFSIDWSEVIESITGFVVPDITLDFDLEDNAGIHQVQIWVNKNTNESPDFSKVYSNQPKEVSVEFRKQIDIQEAGTAFGVQDIDVFIEVTDINGNSFITSQTKKGFVVEFVNSVYERIVQFFKDVGNVVKEALDVTKQFVSKWINDFKETAIWKVMSDIGSLIFAVAQDIKNIIVKDLILAAILLPDIPLRGIIFNSAMLIAGIGEYEGHLH